MTPFNPLLGLPFEPAIEGLGPEYWDLVEAASFPLIRLRFRNDALFGARQALHHWLESFRSAHGSEDGCLALQPRTAESV